MSSRLAVACLVVSACGRIGFDHNGDARNATDADAQEADGIDASGTPGIVSWVDAFVGLAVFNDSATGSFTAQAHAVGNAVVIHASCQNTTALPASVTITAPGWTFSMQGIVNSTKFAVASLVAIAPDTVSATFTTTWSSDCDTAINWQGDEFTGADPTGGSTTFDTHDEASGIGDCATTLTTGHAGDAIWAGCTSGTFVSTGTGFTTGADDLNGDLSEWKLTDDPAGTLEPVGFSNDVGQPFGITAVSIKPAG